MDTLKRLKEFILSYSNMYAALHFSDYDGRSLFNLLKRYNWTYQPKSKKYYVELVDKTQGTLQPVGQKIRVKLPTISQDITEEYLMNFTTLQQLFLPEIQFESSVQSIKIDRISNTIGNEQDDELEYINCIYNYFFVINKWSQDQKEARDS